MRGRKRLVCHAKVSWFCTEGEGEPPVLSNVDGIVFEYLLGGEGLLCVNSSL